MGLDGVELVMAVEDRFGVKLRDSECSRVRTVADLAALVIAHLSRPSASSCPSAKAFYDLRLLLGSEGDVPRGKVRPGARLDGLFTAPELARGESFAGPIAASHRRPGPGGHALKIPAENSGQRLAAQQRVLEEVRRLTSEQLGIPIEKVQPESDFVRDLDLD